METIKELPILEKHIEKAIKECTECRECKPLTEEYFYRRSGKDSKYFCSMCRKCENKRTQAYRAKNKEAVLQKNRASYKADSSKSLAASKRWQTNNKERHLIYRKTYYYANREQEIERSKKYSKKNPHYARLSAKNRRARKKNAVGKITIQIISEINKQQRNRCVVCNLLLRKKYHIDHIQPLSKGGSNLRSNLQLLCPPCNMEKSDKDPIDFMQSKGFLL